jgi:hypothetical protein
MMDYDSPRFPYAHKRLIQWIRCQIIGVPPGIRKNIRDRSSRSFLFGLWRLSVFSFCTEKSRLMKNDAFILHCFRLDIPDWDAVCRARNDNAGSGSIPSHSMHIRLSTRLSRIPCICAGKIFFPVKMPEPRVLLMMDQVNHPGNGSPPFVFLIPFIA